MDIKNGAGERELASKLFCIGFFALCGYLLFRYAFGALLPFIIAYLVSLAITPLAKKTAEKTKIPKKFCAAVYVTLAIAVLVAAAGFGIARLFREAEELVSAGTGAFSGIQRVFESFGAPLDWLRQKLGDGSDGISSLEGSLSELIEGIESKVLEVISNAIPKLLSSLISYAPSIFIGIAVTLMACYYFCMDGAPIEEGIKKMLPLKYRDNIVRTVSVSKQAVKKYAKAYLVLMLITFAEVFIGLLILKVRYALIIALGVAAVDILPVLGAGAVLVPWAVIVFIMGDTSLSLGLLILYGVITVIRQITEPHIIGTSIGLHPAASLFSMYAGFKLFGIVGMILGPAVAFVIGETVKREEA